MSVKKNWFGLFEKLHFDFMMVRSFEYDAVNMCI